jgi:hypothetical protein
MLIDKYRSRERRACERMSGKKGRKERKCKKKTDR